MRALLWGIVISLGGCSDGDDEDTEDCDEGFERHADGNCYETESKDSEDTGTPPAPEGSPLEEMLDALPPCESTTGDGELDLANLCAGPLCVDMTYAELYAADAEEPDCDFDADDDFVCTWGSLGLEVWFWDENDDEVIESDQFPTGMYAYEGFDGSTQGGVRVGASVACFIDDLGNPLELTLFDYGGEFWVYYYAFNDYDVYAVDAYDGFAFGGDGYADAIWLNGPG